MPAIRIKGLILLPAILLVLAGAAQGEDQATSHACYSNDAIVGGKRMQPTQAEIAERLDTPECRAVFGDNGGNVDGSSDVQKQLDAIDQEIAKQGQAAKANIPPAN
jgi:hypothetical protein